MKKNLKKAAKKVTLMTGLLSVASTICFAVPGGSGQPSAPAASPAASRAPAAPVAPAAAPAAAAPAAPESNPAASPNSSVSVGPDIGFTPNAGVLPGFNVGVNARSSETVTSRTGRRSYGISLDGHAIMGTPGFVGNFDLHGGAQWRYLLSPGVQLTLSADGRSVQLANVADDSRFGFTGAQGSARIDLGTNHNFGIQIGAGIGGTTIPNNPDLGFLSQAILSYQHICANNIRCWELALQHDGVIDISGRMATRNVLSANIPTAARPFGLPMSLVGQAGVTIATDQDPAFVAMLGLRFTGNPGRPNPLNEQVARIDGEVRDARNANDRLAERLNSRTDAMGTRIAAAQQSADAAREAAALAQQTAEDAAAAAQTAQETAEANRAPAAGAVEGSPQPQSPQ